MANICLNKLGSNITKSCVLPVHGIKDIYLMHVEDVMPVLSAYGSVWSGISFSDGAKSYRVEGYKQNIQVTTSVRSLDASNKLDISVSFKIPHSASGSTIGTLFKRVILTGAFYVLVVCNDSSMFIVGSQSPLACSGFDWDSNANGQLQTVTLTAPDGSAGNYITDILQPVATSIISKSA